MSAGGLPSTGPWPAVGRLIDRAATESDLVAHRLVPLAARHWAATAPERLSEAMRIAEFFEIATHHAAIRTLRLVREVLDGRVMVFKGIAAAAAYPDLGLRPFSDIDLLVDDPDGAYAALVAAGFRPVGREPSYYEGLQHLRPLQSPLESKMMIELHRHVSWVPWCPPPASVEILDAGRESLPALEGVLVPDPAHHAIVLAAHSCATMPLRAIGDVLDVYLMKAQADEQLLRSAAVRWRADRLMHLYSKVAETLFADGARPLPTWARGIAEVRDVRVGERYVAMLRAPFSTHSLRDMPFGLWFAIATLVAPAENETASTKLARAIASARSANKPLSEHSAQLGDPSRRVRHRRR